MNGRKSKQAHRLLKEHFPDVSNKPEHTNIKHLYVDIPTETLNPDGTPFRVRFHYTTSTVTIPARKYYRYAKRTLVELAQ